MKNQIINDIEIAKQYSSNTNLLDNWYFARPINQRNVQGGSDWGRYHVGIDRWCRDGDGASYVRDGYIEQINSWMYQILDFKADAFLGMTLTISSLDRYGNLITATGVVPPANSTWQVIAASSQCSVKISDGNNYLAIINQNECIAAKLEINDHQTLAHQLPSGKWELNEIPTWELELIKCQRFFRIETFVPVCFRNPPWIFPALTFPEMHHTPTLFRIGRICGKDGKDFPAGWSTGSFQTEKNALKFVEIKNCSDEIFYLYDVWLTADL